MLSVEYEKPIPRQFVCKNQKAVLYVFTFAGSNPRLARGRAEEKGGEPLETFRTWSETGVGNFLFEFGVTL